jgi:hypothetical protein
VYLNEERHVGLGEIDEEPGGHVEERHNVELRLREPVAHRHHRPLRAAPVNRPTILTNWHNQRSSPQRDSYVRNTNPSPPPLNLKTDFPAPAIVPNLASVAFTLFVFISPSLIFISPSLIFISPSLIFISSLVFFHVHPGK